MSSPAPERSRSRFDWSDVFDGLRSQGFRLVLSFGGIAVGMTCLVVLLAVLAGLRERGRELIRDLGTNTFAIVDAGGEQGMDAGAGLRRRHLAILKQNLPDIEATAMGMHAEVELEGHRGALLAADEDVLKVRPWRLMQGRGLDRADIDSHSRVALIGTGLTRALGLGVGGVIHAGGLPFRIVGVLGGGSGGTEAGAGDPRLTIGEQVVIVPWTVSPFRSADGNVQAVDAIFVRYAGEKKLEDVMSVAGGLLSAPDCRLAGANWISADDLLAGVRKMRQTVLLSGGALAGLCLLLGAVTLATVLMAAVESRVPEIGLRRALGASSRDIGLLFLGEGLVVSFGASLLALLLGLAVLGVLARVLPVPLRVDLWVVLLPPLCGAGVGALASWLPARSAAGIAPAEALRND